MSFFDNQRDFCCKILSLLDFLQNYKERKNMAKNLEIGEMVYVPRTRVGLNENEQSAIYKGKIVSLNQKSICVELPKGEISKPVSFSAVSRDLGILILRIGDLESENTLLDPLYTSILQYFRLLLKDDEITSESIRTVSELKSVWKKYHALISHVIFIGHGRDDAIRFMNEWINAEQLNEILDIENSFPKHFVSLCCQTGCAGFGKKFSTFRICQSLIAPFQNVHSSIASQFCQIYFACHFLQGMTLPVAFKNARNFVTGTISFRLWKNGDLKAGART